MKYIYTRKTREEVNLSPETSLAVSEFAKTLKMEKRLKEQEDISTYWLSQVPEGEMKAYVDITTEMLNE